MYKKSTAPFRTIEQLEDRWTPAGIATALLTGGDLIISGDELANVLTVTQRSDSRLVLTPSAGTQVRLGPDGILQSGPVVLPTPVRDHVFANLFAGNDRITFNGVTLPGRLSINQGEGNNQVDLTNVVVRNDLSIRNLEGMDTANLLNEVTVMGNLDIDNGDGGSLVNDNASTTLRVVGNFSVVSGRGADSIALDNAQSIHVGGQVIVRTDSTGGDTASSDTRFDTRAGGLTLGGVDVVNGNGTDTVRFDSDGLVTIQAVSTIRNGNGNSNSTFTSSTNLYLGGLSIINGTGADVNQVTSNGITEIKGNVLFNNRRDTAANTNTVAGNTSLLVSGDVIFNNGDGSDTNTIGGTVSRVVRVMGRIIVDNQEGTSSTSIGRGNTSLHIQGVTRVTSGAGNDTVIIGANSTPDVTLGAVELRSGAGANQTTIAGRRLHMNGALSVSGGNGTDELTVTTGTQDGTIAGDVDISLGRGDNQRVALQALNNNSRLTLGRSLSIVTNDQTAGGIDQITLTRIGVRSRTTIRTAAGNDTIAIDDADLNRFDLDTGDGNDTVNLDRGNFNGTTRFYGAVTVHTGAGNDTVNVGTAGNASRQVIFASSCLFHGGSGHDTINILVSGNAITFGNTLTLRFFEVIN